MMNLLFFIALLCVQLVPFAAAADDCKCANQWTSVIMSKLGTFPPQQLKKYEYTGAIVGPMGSYYKPCVCTDVLRLKMDLTVKSADLFAATATSNVTGATQNITDTLSSLVPNMEGYGDLSSRFESFFTSVGLRVAPDSVTFNLEIVLRGANESYAPLVKLALENVTAHTLPALGSFTASATTIVKCTGNPAAAPAGISRTWTGAQTPPTKAYYKCPAGQYVLPLNEGVSTCNHTSLTWSTLPTLSCTSGCGLEPPALPLFASRDWNNSTRTIGISINYYCQYGYRSANGANSTSNCSTTGWNDLSPTFFCSEKPCNAPIPQVPPHGQTDFVETKRSANTVVTYSCIVGYRPANSLPDKITCSLGQWSLATPGWNCRNINSFKASDTVKGEMEIPDHELTDAERQRKLAMFTEPHYFWMVTIPSIIGLIIAMVICLCCTRTDSPLFNICGGHKPNSFGYQDYMKKFGNT